MKRKKEQNNKNHSMLALDIATLWILFFISVLGLVAIGYITWENADEAGRRMANSYCMAEEHSFNTYKDFLEIGANYIDDMEKRGLNQQEIEEYMMEYFEEIKTIVGVNEIEPYAVVDGYLMLSDRQIKTAIANYKIDEEDVKDPQEFTIIGQEWYRKALAAEGEVIITDAYEDQIYARPVITLAKGCSHRGDVVAIDVLEADLEGFRESQELPEGSVSYVYDSRGMLFYTDAEEGEDEEAFLDYTRELFQKVEAAEGTKGPLYIKDMQGKTQTIYYREDVHGGYCILTMPHMVLLLMYGKNYGYYVIAFVLTISFMFRLWIEGYRKRKDNERMDETVQVLGSAYYSLYRINLEEASYENIKGAEFLDKNLPRVGKYEELLGKFEAIIPKDTYQDFMESFSLENIHTMIEEQKKDFGGDFQREFNGVYEWVNVRILYEPELSKNEVVLCFRKAGEEKRAQLRYMETLKEALEAERQSENTQKQFFSNMSHDMRTPLNGILGICEIAVNHIQEPEKMADYLEKISFSGKQLLELINDILEISRLEQGMVLENSCFDFYQSIEEGINVFALRAEAEGKRFIRDYRPKEELVYGDSRRLNQVLNNLLSNALKFTEKGQSITVRIRCLGGSRHRKYCIEVSDTGMGMSEGFLTNIFEPYQREKHFGYSVEGTGLGMPIVKSIVSQMGGEIAVESTLNKGSKFTITLPLEAVEKKPAGKEHEDTEELPEKTQSYTLEGKRILLAEDYELNMEIATEILEMEGVEVVPAWNGREALEKFEASEEYSFSAILMDMQMPEMDGCQATEAIRRLPRADASEIPIIALTANAFAENIVSTVQAGMDAHIVKPIDVDLLCETLGRLIREREDRRKDGRGISE